MAPVTVAGMTLRMVSLEDMIARHARLSWDLLEGNCVAPKFARDFLRMIDLVPPTQWRAFGSNIGNPDSRKALAKLSCSCVRQLRRALTYWFRRSTPQMCTRSACVARRSKTSR